MGGKLKILSVGGKLPDYMNEDKDKKIEQLIKEYTTPVYNFIAQILGYGSEAEDVTQETFIKVWKNWHKFDQTKNFKPWLFQIAKNTALDRWRRREPIRSFVVDSENGFDEKETIADLAPTPFEQTILAEQTEILKQAIAKLPEIYRAVINLYYLNGFSLPEISEIWQESVDTVKSRHRRALIKLRQILHP